MGGSVVYWFCGASRQAVTTGAYRAVRLYQGEHQPYGHGSKASAEDSNEVVRICTKYAQYGMLNIFVVVFSLALAFACFNPVFFVGYLISIAMFGLFMAINMANAGGCWDNAKKIVEVEMREKGTALHAATVIGDIVGDPFKDTSSVALNPIIKFTTLFGILAVGNRDEFAAARVLDSGRGLPVDRPDFCSPFILLHAHLTFKSARHSSARGNGSMSGEAVRMGMISYGWIGVAFAIGFRRGLQKRLSLPFVSSLRMF